MKKLWMVPLFVILLGLCALAQDKPADKPVSEPQIKQDRPVSYYKVEFVLRELQDGKAINTRNYLMTIENGDRGEAKVGARVPVTTGEHGQFQYLDVGININCRVVGRDDYASLRSMIEISSFALPEQASGGNSQPVVRQMRSDLAAVVPLSKQTVIGIIDDANSTKRYEIAVTATKMK
jgi:hypothetical protein